MTVRLYRAAAKFRGYVDEFTLYFRYPKWMQEQIFKTSGHRICGFGIGCSQDSGGGVIRCDGFDDDRTLGYHPNNLGRKYPLEKMSEEFQKWACSMEKAWNDALKFNDERHWEIWNHA